MFFLDRRKADSLHYVWDTALVREIIGRRAIAPVAEAMSKVVNAKQRKEWAAGTPESWANEAHRVAVEKVYGTVAPDDHEFRGFGQSSEPTRINWSPVFVTK